MPDDYARALREWGARKLAAHAAQYPDPDELIYWPDVSKVTVTFEMETEYETFGSYTRGFVSITDGHRFVEIHPDDFDFAKVLQEIMEGT